MVTKTEPKRAADTFMVAVKFSSEDKIEILSILGLKKAALNRQAIIINALERDLSFGFNKLRRAGNKPFPEHTRITLGAIFDASEKLKNLLNPVSLTIEVRRALGFDHRIDSGILYMAVIALAEATTEAIHQIDHVATKGSGGKLRQRQREMVDAVQDGLDIFFRNNVHGVKPDRVTKHRADFMKICLRYIKRAL